MMGSFGFVIAVLALVAPAAAADAAEQPVPEPSAMVVEFPHGARFAGSPRRCPGSFADEEEEETEQICSAEFYQGRIWVSRHLSGPRVKHGTILRLTAHARRWKRGTRMLVESVPFQDGSVSGHFAYWWDLPEANGAFCVTGDDLARWEDSPLRRAFAAGSRRRFRPSGYSEAADFRCIRDSRANR